MPEPTGIFDNLGGLGVGGGPLGNLYSAISDTQARETLELALDSGVRYFDTAPFYGFGLSERRFGDALRGRDGYVLSTKVGRLLEPIGRGRQPDRSVFDTPMPFEVRWDYSYDGVMRSFEQSLQRLAVPAIDILLFHDLAEDAHEPEALAANRRVAFERGWRAAQELKRDGLVSAVGFGLNSIEAARIAIDACAPDCVLLASRYTLLEQTAALPFLGECLSRGVAVLAGAPFNSGILVQGSAATSTYDHQAAPGAVVERVRRLEAICQHHGVALPAAALQFPRRHPAVRAVVAGFRSPEELAAAVLWRDAVIPKAFWEEAALT